MSEDRFNGLQAQLDAQARRLDILDETLAEKCSEWEILKRMRAMCEESLDPPTFDEWLNVEAMLKENRKAFRQSAEVNQ